jgi:hypothetical protein
MKKNPTKCDKRMATLVTRIATVLSRIHAQTGGKGREWRRHGGHGARATIC